MSQRASVISWWVALAAVVALIVLPGPSQSAFSGTPLSSRSLILFVALVILGVFTAMYPPVRGVRVRWLIVLLVLVVAKIGLGLLLGEAGGRAEHWTAWLITIAVVLALAVLFSAFTDAYPRMSVLALEHIWSAPTKVASCLFFAFFLAWGVRQTLSLRQDRALGGRGDGPQATASEAVHNAGRGASEARPGTTAGATDFHPLYSMALAGTRRILLGPKTPDQRTANSDQRTATRESAILFNYLCLASLGIFCGLLLGNRVSSGAGVAVLGALAWFLWRFAIPDTGGIAPDNLYLPIVLAVVVAAVAALDRRSLPCLLLTGAATALGAATRPWFLCFVPLFGLWLLLDREAGAWWARLRAFATFVAGFFAGIAPFAFGKGSPGFLVRVPQLLDLWHATPLLIVWTAVRKVFFTMGLTGSGLSGIEVPFGLFLFPLLFGMALWSGRMPRNVRNVVIVFGVSHIAALVMAARWTYGTEAILPLHMLFLISAAFILPNWGEQRERVPSAERAGPVLHRRTVSVVLPTYNERDSIAAVVQGFLATGVVDEVLVVNNNAVEGTSEAIAGTGAREIFESRQGYGAAIQRGMREAACDLIVICEPDGTFVAEDIHKFLAYADDFDVVYGSRTSHGLVWRGANMGLFLRWGNWAVAKYLELLYNTSSLTDAGCTYRLITREAAAALREQFRIDGSQFGPEMMIVSLRAGYRAIQIPVNYRPRIGVSSVTGDPAKAFLLGLRMIWLITTRRFEDLIVTAPPRAARTPGLEGERT